MAKSAVSRKLAKKHIISDANSNKRKRPKSKIPNGGNNNSKGSASLKVLVIVFIAVGVACIGLGAYYYALPPVFVWDLASKTMQKEQVKEKIKPDERVVPKEVQDFKPTIQSTLQMKSIQVNGKELKIQALKHDISESTVKAYIVDGFLSDYECDGLASVHGRHVHELVTKNGPIICFAGIESLRKYLKGVGLKMKLTTRDFTEGTTCVNETLSNKLKTYLRWSFSTAFYPGENTFSTTYAEKVEKVAGLKQENGGKFQITSYPRNVGYKNHTDCVVAEDGQGDKRDRYATVLVYLRDVEEGGETSFPQLGISVKPKKGRALIWNSMTIDGNCDPTSLHNAANILRGHKIILQRWYYYKNFPALGMRAPEPHLPARKPDQPRVTCDEYEQGSCRWYDEWNYEHIVEYAANTDNMI